MSKYGLHGILIATEGNGEKLTSILLEASKLVAAAKGCNLYLVSIDETTDDSVWVTEVWDSKEDHDNSLKIEAVGKLIAQAMPILHKQQEKGQELEVLGGAGIE